MSMALFSEEVQKRIESGDIIGQKCWQYIKEVNGTDEDRLGLVAVTDCRRKYTYRQMFDLWDQYARVFSALGITGRDHARAGLGFSPCAELSFSFFGLNMTGASVSMIQLSSEEQMKKLKELVRKERITDLILTDRDMDPPFLRRLLREKDSMGINNVIMLHVPVCGDLVFALEELACNINYRRIREVPGAVFMKDLLKKYSGHGISLCEDVCDDAVIVHTSGTTEGVPEPVPFSDRAVNETMRRYTADGKTLPKKGRLITMVIGRTYSGSSFTSMLLPLATGGNLVTHPLSVPGLRYLFALSHYRVTNILYFAGLIDLITLLPVRPDLSSLQTVKLVGSYVSADTLRKTRKFFRECGSDANVIVGYGLTEAGVGLTLSDPDTEDDSVGHLQPGVKIRLRDEDEDVFFAPDGKEHTGVLFVSTPSISGGRLDDETIFELDEIDGEKYLNTHDVLKINGDGALYFIGRAGSFFISDEGTIFDAGLAERAISAQKGIKACGIVPEYNKMIHETEPALYVETESQCTGGYRVVRKALEQVYIKDGMIGKTALPVRCVLTDEIPRNMNGKVDVHKITEGEVHGASFVISGVYESNELKEIDMTPGGAESFGVKGMGCDCFQ